MKTSFKYFKLFTFAFLLSTFAFSCEGQIPSIGGMIVPKESSQTASFTWGNLYNWWAAIGDTDGDNIAETSIAASGWHLPDNAEMYYFLEDIGGKTVSGGYLKETGTDHWNFPNTGAANTFGFNNVGTGQRNSTGNFEFRYEISIHVTSSQSGTNCMAYILGDKDHDNSSQGWTSKKYGFAVRLVKDATSLNSGETGTYTGNDGTVYPTICIGTPGNELEFTACDIFETKYRDGTSIPIVADNASWSALSTHATCIYIE